MRNVPGIMQINSIIQNIVEQVCSTGVVYTIIIMLSAMYAKLKFISSSISLYFFGCNQVFFCVAVAMKCFVEIVKFKFSGILLKERENGTVAVSAMLVSLLDL